MASNGFNGLLNNGDIKVNHKTVSRLMSQHSLIYKGARKSYRCAPNSKPYEEKENILNRVFTEKERNKI